MPRKKAEKEKERVMGKDEEKNADEECAEKQCIETEESSKNNNNSESSSQKPTVDNIPSAYKCFHFKSVSI